MTALHWLALLSAGCWALTLLLLLNGVAPVNVIISVRRPRGKGLRSKAAKRRKHYLAGNRREHWAVP